jgi:hypothetical protein
MSSTTARSRRPLVLSLLIGVVAALGGAVGAFAPAGGASLPTPTSMVITEISSVDPPGGLPDGAAPNTLVVAGGTLTVHVVFSDGGAPAAFKSDTELKITSTGGTLTTTTGVAAAGQPSADITTSIKAPVNQVGLTLTVSKGPSKGLSTGTPDPALLFDVLSDLRFEDSVAGFQQGIGGGSNCAIATPGSPVCAIVMLPNGSSSSQVLLSLGLCDTDPGSTYAPCHVGPKGPGGAVVQTLFGQASVPYTVDSPATVVVKCDKSLCGTGPIQALTVIYSLGGNSPLTAAGECPAKGTMATAGVPCVDYVQSKRDGSGDTHLYLLTDRDLRGGIG